jgi:hypothetical protein
MRSFIDTVSSERNDAMQTHQTAPVQKKYWVVGAEYTDTGFNQPIDGTQQLIGPFETYASARATWQERAQATRGFAHVRFTIAQEGGVS